MGADYPPECLLQATVLRLHPQLAELILNGGLANTEVVGYLFLSVTQTTHHDHGHQSLVIDSHNFNNLGPMNIQASVAMSVMPNPSS